MTGWLRLQGHALAEALRRISAQPVASAFSILVLAIAIALPVIAAVVLQSAGAIASSLETDPHVNVYLALDATDEDVRRVGEALRASPDAASVEFVPRDKALAELKASTHLADVIDSLQGNPLPHAFIVRVRTDDSAKVAAAREAWSKLPKVDQVAADFEWAHRLGNWIRFGRRLLTAVAIALGGAVAFIAGPLIRLQALSHREEIEVSQLVGATASDVRRPFLYHGLLQGALAGGLAVGLGALAALWLGAEVRALTPEYASELKIVSLDPTWSLGCVAIAAALGLAGAWWAVTRELRQFSPIR
ncbi:MAG TPA: ABC transporter permease [Usitatibacter sp.]|nr:ABC transporter permease [Usitatibacter sp.]